MKNEIGTLSDNLAVVLFFVALYVKVPAQTWRLGEKRKIW